MSHKKVISYVMTVNYFPPATVMHIKLDVLIGVKSQLLKAALLQKVTMSTEPTPPSGLRMSRITPRTFLFWPKDPQKILCPVNRRLSRHQTNASHLLAFFSTDYLVFWFIFAIFASQNPHPNFNLRAEEGEL